MTKELLNRQLRIARTFRADIKAKCAAFEDDFRRIKRTKSVFLKNFSSLDHTPYILFCKKYYNLEQHMNGDFLENGKIHNSN